MEIPMEVTNKLPEMPRDGSIDETDGQAVFNWVLNEMRAGTIGWLKFNLISIKSRSFVPLPWHHQGRIETERLHLEFPDLYKDNQGISEYIAKDEEGWKPWDDFPAPQMSAYLNTEIPSDTINRARYTRIPPNTTTVLHEPSKDLKFENLETDIIKILMTLVMPNTKKCVLEVDGFDAVNLQEGIIYFLNPFRKQSLKNTSDLDYSTQLDIELKLGKQCSPFSDVITRSYFQAIGHMQK